MPHHARQVVQVLVVLDVLVVVVLNAWDALAVEETVGVVLDAMALVQTVALPALVDARLHAAMDVIQTALHAVDVLEHVMGVERAVLEDALQDALDAQGALAVAGLPALGVKAVAEDAMVVAHLAVVLPALADVLDRVEDAQDALLVADQTVVADVLQRVILDVVQAVQEDAGHHVLEHVEQVVLVDAALLAQDVMDALDVEVDVRQDAMELVPQDVMELVHQIVLGLVALVVQQRVHQHVQGHVQEHVLELQAILYKN